MKCLLLLTCPLLALGSLPAAEITLTAPLDYQVVQRSSRSEGRLEIRGTHAGLAAAKAVWRAKLGPEAAWQPLAVTLERDRFSASMTAPAGGWHRLELEVAQDGQTVARGIVEHVGIGEVFVVAGQSNSANHGEERQTTQTRRVAAFDGRQWRLANDPQPGASGQMGSFMPPLGDELVRRLDVPVGFIACGIGATSVREWLPKGEAFPNPPTLEGRVEKRADDSWASNGAAYAAFIGRLRPFGPDGFRAVLWHQGESDANQRDPARTLSGSLYRDCLEKLIRASRRDAGFEVPWFVAQASYHVPGDEGSDDIRAAQASLWKDGLALQGPDSDALKGPLRERNGQGVHFSGPGLRLHGQKWAERVGAWIEAQIAAAPTRPDAAWLRETGTRIFHDAFEREEDGNLAKAIGNGWNSATADRVPRLKQADIDGGILKIASATKAAGHAAHIHHEAGFADGGAIVRFRFPGENRGESLQLGFVDRETNPGVHAGHLCYGILSPTRVTLIDQKTGVMNLEIRGRRQGYLERKEKLPPDLEALLKTKSHTVPFKVDTQWHELVLVTEGDEMRLSLDGKTIASHRSAGFAHPVKRWFSFLISSTVWIDDVQIWRVR